MSPATRHARDAEPALGSQRKPIFHILFLLQALLAFAGSLLGNGLADRLREDPVVPYLWTLLGLVIVVLLGLITLRMDEATATAAGPKRASAPPPGLRGLLAAPQGLPLTALPLAFLLGTLIAALAVVAVPRGDVPLGLLWGYEAAAFVVSLVPAYFAVAWSKDLMVHLSIWLGLAFGASEGLLLLRPLENGALYTTLGWVVAVCLPGLFFRSRLFKGFVDDCRALLRDRAARCKR